MAQVQQADIKILQEAIRRDSIKHYYLWIVECARVSGLSFRLNKIMYPVPGDAIRAKLVDGVINLHISGRPHTWISATTVIDQMAAQLGMLNAYEWSHWFCKRARDVASWKVTENEDGVFEKKMLWSNVDGEWGSVTPVNSREEGIEQIRMTFDFLGITANLPEPEEIIENSIPLPPDTSGIEVNTMELDILAAIRKWEFGSCPVGILPHCTVGGKRANIRVTQVGEKRLNILIDKGLIVDEGWRNGSQHYDLTALGVTVVNERRPISEESKNGNHKQRTIKPGQRLSAKTPSVSGPHPTDGIGIGK